MSANYLRIGTDAQTTIPSTCLACSPEALASWIKWVYLSPEQDCQFTSIDGFVLSGTTDKQSSTKVNSDSHDTSAAAMLAKYYSLIPVAQQEQLADPQQFDNFMLRVQATHNFREQVLNAPSKAALTRFHARYKYLLMAHHPDLCRYMGYFLAQTQQSFEQHCSTYQQMLMQALSVQATRKNHTNALQHMLGYLRKTVSVQARQLLAKSIHDFYHGTQSLQVPLSLLHHYAMQLDKDYLRQQQYFMPYPSHLHPSNYLDCPQ